MSSLRAVISVGAMVVGVLLLYACEEKIKPTVLFQVDSRTIPQQESWNSTVTLSDSGRVKAVINAGYIRVYETPRQTLLSDGVVVHFFNEEGKRSSVLTSKEGKVNDVNNDLEAYGNVVVVSEDSTILRTEKLFWSNSRQRVHTPEFVKISSPEERIQGRGFEAEQNLGNYRIFHVTGEAKTD